MHIVEDQFYVIWTSSLCLGEKPKPETAVSQWTGSEPNT